MVGHTPRFDPERNLWYCDVELDAGAAYQPFVRLALCRFQRHSIDGHHISRVVLADYAQLLARREATVRRLLGGRMQVSLRGPVGVGRLGGGAVTASGVRASRVVTAEMQRRAEGADPDLGWARVGPPTYLDVAVGDGGLADVTWTASIGATTFEAGFVYRLLVQEHEIHPTDVGDQLDPFESEWSSGPVEFPTQVRQRLIYADTFPL